MANLFSEDKRAPPEERHYSLFDEILNKEDRKYILRHGRSYITNDGKIICHQDQISDNLFFILQGEVKITIKSGEKEFELGTLSAGNIFGEISALISAPRIATVATNKPSIILEINKNVFIKLLEQAPNLRKVVYKQLSERKLQTAIQTQQAVNS